MWIDGQPQPIPPDCREAEYEPSRYDEDAIDEIITSCKTPRIRAWLNGLEPLEKKGAYTICEMNYYPTRFNKRQSPYAKEYARTPRLYMPFSKDDFDGAVFVDELG